MKNLLKFFLFIILINISTTAYTSVPIKKPVHEKTGIEQDKHGYQNQFKESSNYQNSFTENLVSATRNKSLRFQTYPILIFILVILALLFIKISSPDFYRELYTHLINSKLFITAYPAKRISLRINNLLMDSAKIFVLTLLFFETLNDHFTVSFWQIFFIITGYSFMRITVIFIFYYLFFDKGFVNIHLGNIFIFNRMMFLILLPFAFFTIFSYPPYTLIFQWFSLALLILFVILRIQRIFIQIKMAKNYTFLYIFLYIFVFEISPFFILLKEFTQNHLKL